MLHLPTAWNAFNLELYTHWAATPTAPALGIELARFFAADLIYLAPLLLIWGWLRRPDALRPPLLQAAAATLLALGLNQFIGLLVFEPRPFAIGLGPALLAHAPDSGLPSDHFTVIWAVAATLLLAQPWRKFGLLLTLLGVPVAWARVYLGVHWPLDMAGAAFSGAVAAIALQLVRHQVIAPLMPLLTRTYRKLFAPAIRLGWALP